LEGSPARSSKFLAQGEVVLNTGALTGAVKTDLVTVTVWDCKPTVAEDSFDRFKVPLAGFSILEAANANEVVLLVAGTPCARAQGAIEIRPILMMNSGWQSGS
jgi:hypothetical protein